MHTSRFEQLAGGARIDTKTFECREFESNRRKSIERDETRRNEKREKHGSRKRSCVAFRWIGAIPLASSRAIRHSHWLSPKSPPIRRHLSANTRNQFARAQRCFSFLHSSHTCLLLSSDQEEREEEEGFGWDDDRCEDLANVSLERSTTSQLDYRSTIRLGLVPPASEK